MRIRTLILALATVLGLALSPVAQASPTLDFGIPGIQPGTASIAYTTTGGSLVGSGITVNNVAGILGTPLNNLVTLVINSGVLAFTTGNLTSTDANSWNFGAGGTVTINGTIPAQTPAGGTAFSPAYGPATLLSGTFESASVTSLGNGTAKIAGAVFFNSVDPILAAYYGLGFVPAGGWSGAFNISFTTAPTIANPPSTFTSSGVTSGDVSTTPVPEPATVAMALSGLPLLGLFLARRRKG